MELSMAIKVKNMQYKVPVGNPIGWQRPPFKAQESAVSSR